MKIASVIAMCAALLFPAHAMQPTTFNPQRSSFNWSGYALKGTDYSHVSGTFQVPDAKSNYCQAFFSQWVGIDGLNNNSLIQAGIGESSFNNAGDCTPGKTSFEAWWEVLPAPETQISLPVSPGDSITVDIEQVYKTEWNIRVTNNTENLTFLESVYYNGPKQSAEWVVETPDVGGAITPMMSFGTATFTNLQTTGNYIQRYNMVLSQYGVKVAVPDVVSDNPQLFTDGFSVIFLNTGSGAAFIY